MSRSAPFTIFRAAPTALFDPCHSNLCTHSLLAGMNLVGPRTTRRSTRCPGWGHRMAGRTTPPTLEDAPVCGVRGGGEWGASGASEEGKWAVSAEEEGEALEQVWDDVWGV